MRYLSTRPVLLVAAITITVVFACILVRREGPRLAPSDHPAERSRENGQAQDGSQVPSPPQAHLGGHSASYSAGIPDSRRLWFFCVKGKLWGLFRKQGSQWVESIYYKGQSQPTIILYQESLGTGEYIQLKMQNGTVLTRLYRDCCMMESEPDSEWQVVYKGSWVGPQTGGGLALTDEEGSQGITINMPETLITPNPPTEAETESTQVGSQRQNAADSVLEQFQRQSILAQAKAAAAKQAQQQGLPQSSLPSVTTQTEQKLQNEAAQARKLIETAQTLASDPTYQPVGSETKCNYFVRDFAKKAYGKDFDELRNPSTGKPYTANEMHDKLFQTWNAHPILPYSKGWIPLENLFIAGPGGDVIENNTPEAFTKALFKKAQELANRGQLVVVAWKNQNGPHGHVAIVMPSPRLVPSGKWNMEVPTIAQAGKTVDASTSFASGFARSNTKLPSILDAGQSDLIFMVYYTP